LKPKLITDNFNAQNGLTEHHNVLWQFLSSENGDPLTAANINETFSKNYQYNTINLSHPSFEANQVYTNVFVQNNATINLTISGGSGNYGIFWNQGAFTPSINNLTEGTYTVVVTDNLGASVTNQFMIECCNADLMLQNSQFNDQIFQVDNSINSTASNFANVEYIVGQQITLNEGFSTNNPCSFAAKIENCQ